MKYRIQVEIEYLIALSGSVAELDDFPAYRLKDLRGIFKNFTEKKAEEIKEIEKTTNHDVKALEYFIKKEFDALKLDPFKEFVHFGLTSQDINNTAIPLLLKNFIEDEYFPKIESLLSRLNGIGKDWKDVPMLAHTHGQPASPTRVGKEIMVFATRIEKQLNQVKAVPYSAKFGGATGNLNAHYVAYPGIDWNKFADDFCNHLGLVRSFPTTQIEHYDNMAALFDGLKRVNTILIDLCRDLWQYISMEYFKQKIKEGEIGSSAMPHKVNPIDFENAEGNLGIANALLTHYAQKLPVSRLQRDLSDSTVRRTFGVALGHTLVAWNNITRGMSRVDADEARIKSELNGHWETVAEGAQTILRAAGRSDAYESLKSQMRGRVLTEADFKSWIKTLDIDDETSIRLEGLSPESYLGLATKIVDDILDS